LIAINDLEEQKLHITRYKYSFHTINTLWPALLAQNNTQLFIKHKW